MKLTMLVLISGMVTTCFSSAAQNADINILKHINPQNPTSAYWTFTSASTYILSASIPTALLAGGFIKNDPVLKRKALEVYGSIVTELIVSEAIKYAINRERPNEKYPNDIYPYKDLHGPSFPSGHTSMSFAAAASVSIQFKKWYVTVPAYLWAGTVGYSRMYLGIHYPSDVLAGAAVGIGSAYLANWLNSKLISNKRKHR